MVNVLQAPPPQLAQSMDVPEDGRTIHIYQAIRALRTRLKTYMLEVAPENHPGKNYPQYARAVMMVMWERACSREGTVKMAIQQIADESDMSRRQVQTVLRHLEAASIIQTIETGGPGKDENGEPRTNIYLITRQYRMVVHSVHQETSEIDNPSAQCAPHPSAQCAQSTIPGVQNNTPYSPPERDGDSEESPSGLKRDSSEEIKQKAQAWLDYYLKAVQKHTGIRRRFQTSKPFLDEYRKRRKNHTSDDMRKVADYAARDKWWNGTSDQHKKSDRANNFPGRPLSILRKKNFEDILDRATATVEGVSATGGVVGYTVLDG